MHYVYSTITCDTSYPEYVDNTNKDLGVIKKRPDGKPMTVIINGGHGVANKHMFTPRGVVTRVSDEDMEYLKANVNFKRHVAAGFITFEKKEVDVEKRAESMNDKDGSAPLTPKDFQEGENSTKDTKVYKKKDAIE